MIDRRSSTAACKRSSGNSADSYLLGKSSEIHISFSIIAKLEVFNK